MEDSMEIQTIERAQLKHVPTGAPTYLGVVAFVVATLWFGLATKGVTVATAPQVNPNATEDQQLHTYYAWFVATLPQERLYASIAIVGFLCLAAIAGTVRDLLGRDRGIARIGASAMSVGSVLWVAATVFQLGGHRAVGMMATHSNPIGAVASIAFTIDTTFNALALASYALVGVGMLAFAIAAAQVWPGSRGWVGCSAVIGVLMLVIAWSYGGDHDDVTSLALFAGGGVLLPLWLLWTERIRRRA
jgi:hypothetical protein